MPMFRVMAKTAQQESIERQIDEIERILRPQLRPRYFLRRLTPEGALDFEAPPQEPEESSTDLLSWTLARARRGLPTDPSLWPRQAVNPHGEMAIGSIGNPGTSLRETIRGIQELGLAPEEDP